MSDDDNPTTITGSRNIVDKMFAGPGFVGEVGPYRVKADADLEACRIALDRLCRHLTAGEIEAALEDTSGIEDVFETDPTSR